jgi:hypothetical protein
MPVATAGGKCYFITFVNDTTCYTTVYLLKNKSDMSTAFVDFVCSAPASFRCVRLWSNNGGEYVAVAFQALLKQHSIMHLPMALHTPKHNRVAERFNCTINTITRSLLDESGLSQVHWGEAICTTMIIYNQLRRDSSTKAPYKAWHGHLAQINHLHIFSCHTHTLIPINKHPKYSPQSRPAIYLRPASEHNTTHHLLLNNTKQIITTQDVIFQENMLPAKTALTSSSAVMLHPKVVSSPSSTSVTMSNTTHMPLSPVPTSTASTSPQVAAASPKHIISNGDASNKSNEGKDSDNSGNSSNTSNHKFNMYTTPASIMKPAQLARCTHQRNVSTPSISNSSGASPPHPTGDIHINATSGSRGKEEDDPGRTSAHQSMRKQFPNMTLKGYVFLANAKPETPNMYTEALKMHHSDRWRRAMDNKINSLKSNSTFSLMPLPPGCKAIGTRWLYKIKCLANRSIDHFKACLIAQGYMQKPGVDYDKTHAPVVKPESLCLVIAYANTLDLKIQPININSAFLHVTFKGEAYIKQAPGYVNTTHPEWVWKLHKSLYRLKQAPLNWYHTINTHLHTHGFEPTEANPCLYVHACKGLISFITLYIDNCTIVAHSSQIKTIKAKIKEGFPIKDLGDATSVLGLKIIHDRPNGVIYIRQRGKINIILWMFSLNKCKPMTIPMSIGTQLDKPANNKPKLDFPFQQVVGMLSYLTHTSQPNIMYTVLQLSQFINCFGHMHIITIKHVIHYLAGTQDLTICFKRSHFNHHKPSTLIPTSYCNANWGNNQPDRKSITGIVFMYSGGPIAWTARFQKSMALWTTEAKLTMISKVTRQATTPTAQSSHHARTSHQDI